MRKVKVAIVQPKRTTNPLSEAKKYISRAHDQGTDIVFFPEFFLVRNGGPIRLDDVYVENLKTTAKENAVYVVTGMYEIGHYSSSVIIDRSGNIVGLHRKTVPTKREKTELGIHEGDDLDVFDIECGKIGMCICYENWFPESARVLRLKGAEMIYAPSEFGMKWAEGDYLERWRMLYIVRAMENEVYYITCTNAFNEQPLAMIIDPEGLVLAERHTEGMLMEELDLGKVEKFWRDEVKPYYCPQIRISVRRPELYKQISEAKRLKP